MVIHLVYFAALLLNAFPAAQGILEQHSPCEIVTDGEIDCKIHCRHVFRLYVEAHKDPSITNDMSALTHADIALDLSGNIQGLQMVFDIETWVVVK